MLSHTGATSSLLLRLFCSVWIPNQHICSLGLCSLGSQMRLEGVQNKTSPMKDAFCGSQLSQPLCPKPLKATLSAHSPFSHPSLTLTHTRQVKPLPLDWEHVSSQCSSGSSDLPLTAATPWESGNSTEVSGPLFQRAPASSSSLQKGEENGDELKSLLPFSLHTVGLTGPQALLWILLCPLPLPHHTGHQTPSLLY